MACSPRFLRSARPLAMSCTAARLYLELAGDRTNQNTGSLMSSAFIQAAVILLREGLEAMLVIAALAGYLTKAGAGHRVQALYGGSLAAVGASIIAAWTSGRALKSASSASLGCGSGSGCGGASLPSWCADS